MSSGPFREALSALHDMNMYERFDRIWELMKLHPYTDTKAFGYGKMVQTGASGIGDYGRGLLYFCVYDYKGPSADGNNIRVVFDTIDDGGVGGWGRAKPNKVPERIVKIAEVMEHVVTLPTFEELQKMFQPFGIYLTYEG